MSKSNEHESTHVNFHKSQMADEKHKTNGQEKPACRFKTEIINESKLPGGDDASDEVISTSSESEAEPVLVVPPDGGWGWFVVFASFMCNLIIDGIIFSFGIFLSDISESFNVTKSQVAIVGSLLSGFYLIAGPFVSALTNKYGFQKVTIVGSVIGALAFVGAAFAENVTTLAILYGVVGGIGFGFVYVPSIIIVGFYFEKWRALATGIAVCGSGIGTFIFAPLATTLLENFGWRTSLMSQAGLILLCALLGAVYRPIKPIKVALDTESETDSTESKDNKKDTQQNAPLLNRLKMTRNRDTKRMSIVSIDGKANKSHYPTAEEIITKTYQKLYGDKSTFSLHVHEIQHPTIVRLVRNEKRLSMPLFQENIKLAAQGISDAQTMDTSSTAKLNRTESVSPDSDVPLISEKIAAPKAGRRTRTMSENDRHHDKEIRSRRGTMAGDEIQRPFYRDDIFFGGNLERLPQYTSHTSLGYHMAVTRMPTKTDIQEENDDTCKICSEAVRRTLSTMFDFSLLVSPTFIILAIGGFLTFMGFYVPFMFIVDRAHLGGLHLDTATWLLSTIGIANTVGRVLCGIISSFPGLNALVINNIAVTIGGVITLLSGLSTSLEYQFFYASIFGLSISCFASLRSVIVVELLGLERLTNAFGFLLLFQGIAAVIGSPIAAAFMEATGSYNASFYLSGGLITLSAVMCYPLNRINKWEKQRDLERKRNLAVV